MPPVIPAAKLSPTSPRITAHPPVIYSQALVPAPSTTAVAPEFLTENLSPACPAAKRYPEVAPYKTVLPIIVFSLVSNSLALGGLTLIVAPERPFPT